MTITAPVPTAPTRAVPADPTRNHARAAGIFSLLTFARAVPHQRGRLRASA